MYSSLKWYRHPKSLSKVLCDNCGYLALFDAEMLGIRGLWTEGREL
jgi:hypothetical protein